MLTRYEQETIVNFNEDDETVSIYTASPIQKRRIEKFRTAELVSVDTQKGKPIAWHYLMPKKSFFYGSRRKLSLSDEQKANLAIRLNISRGGKTNG